MDISITPREHELILRLIDARIQELGPEIRRSRTSEYHDELKQELEDFKALRSRLHESGYDVQA